MILEQDSYSFSRLLSYVWGRRKLVSISAWKFAYAANHLWFLTGFRQPSWADYSLAKLISREQMG